MRQIIILATLFLIVSCATYKTNRPGNYVYWVNSAKVPCDGVGGMHCLNVQKGKKLDFENWQNFYSSIEGFNYQPGYIYKLIVHEEKISKENLPADTSSIKYKLVKVLEKKQDTRLRINDIWVLESIEGKPLEQVQQNKTAKIPQIEFKVANMQVMGNDGCNNFFGSIKKLESEALKFGPLAGTKMACIGTDIPDRFNVALNKTTSYKIENLHLILLGESRNKLLTFKKID